MRPIRIFVAALLVSGAFSAPALGDDIKSALKKFGLIGTWSSNCGKDISLPRTSTVSFAAPSEGGATATSELKSEDLVVTTVYEIVASAIVDGDKIRINFHPVTVTKSGGAAASQHDYDNMQLVFQKVGERIEVIRIEWEGLPEIEQADFFEKCLK